MLVTNRKQKYLTTMKYLTTQSYQTIQNYLTDIRMN